MNEALCSILCDHKNDWTWDPYYSDKIQFNHDGTGELMFIEDFQYLFAVNFKWKSITPPQNKQSEKYWEPEPKPEADHSWNVNSWKRQPQVLGRLYLEITLEKSLANRFSDPTFAIFNEERLTDAACRPKYFTVTIEKGNFLPTNYIGGNNNIYDWRYELRLLFDKTLVPPPEELKLPNGSVIGGGSWWRIKDYVGRSLHDSAKKQTAMNDNTWLFSSSSCALS